MKKLLHRLMKFLAYGAATLVILLAIAVGLFRLLLPRLPEYQEEIKGWASAAIGMEVEFSGMDARWGLSGPELEFYDAQLIRIGGGERLLAADEVRVSVALVRLLVERKLSIDRVVVRQTSVDVRQLEDGSYRVQGLSLDDFAAMRATDADSIVEIELIGEDVELRFMQPGDERPHFFALPDVRIDVNGSRIAVDAELQLPADLGRELQIGATLGLAVADVAETWDLTIEADDIQLAGWSKMVPNVPGFEAGGGDFDLAIALTDGRVTNASANVDLAGVALANGVLMDIEARVEADRGTDGWLIAANELRVSFADHSWPRTSLRIEASTDPDGEIVVLDMRASYLQLDDLAFLEPWLPDAQRQGFAAFAPSGVVQDFVATVSELNTDTPRFEVTADLRRVGLAAADGRPGMRGFTGTIRANRSGGSLDINSTAIQINAPEFIDVPIELNSAVGKVIWRNSANRTTILSDNIRVRSDVFDSQSNVQLLIQHDGSAPVIDLSSRWSVANIAAAKRYIPRSVMAPKLFDWFQTALVSGSIAEGTTDLNGPLDKFPFDGGEGRLLINAAIRDMTFRYHKDWPASEQADLDVVLDNARLYSLSNRSVNAGNLVVDANVNIPDLREPVLAISSLSTGTLESIRQFSLQSPIAKVFGGQLDRVSVAGDASITLNLTVPLKAVHDFEFVANVRSNNGTLSIAGFDPPISDLIGAVRIDKEHIAAESLGGRFLGAAIDIALARSDDPQFAVIASVNGIATAAALIEELGDPLDGLIEGRVAYQARVLFPKSDVESPAPLTVEIASDLQGLAIVLPPPLAKKADEALAVSGDIRFMPDGDRIESAGVAADQFTWRLAFNRPEDVWDFDRGMVNLGGPIDEVADTRGLHIRGGTQIVRLQDWLDLSREGSGNASVAARIRSIDIVVEDMYVLGQHLENHRVRVDRSALDWLVQMDGEDIVGSVFVPYDFGGERAMVLEMQKLRLPGDENDDGSSSLVDPRNLPPITLTADEFAFGDRYVGAVSATIDKVDNGLEASTIHSKDASFEIVGSGRWVVDAEDELGSRSFVTATLSSTNVEQTMARLNYEPGIRSDNMGMLFDLNWSGGPRAAFFDSLSGNVQVRFEKGQLREVEPGAGRMFGLMSIVALPRRLSLDFKDVFGKGFGFDNIAGTFRIVDGTTYTCDLSLEGPAADIGIVGAADIANRTFNQTAIVSANVGNTLPIVGTVVAGPQVGAALFLFSRIFKKPLQEVGQVYYSIGGSWDDPAVDTASSGTFVASGALAGCLEATNGA